MGGVSFLYDINKDQVITMNNHYDVKCIIISKMATVDVLLGCHYSCKSGIIYVAIAYASVHITISSLAFKAWWTSLLFILLANVQCHVL